MTVNRIKVPFEDALDMTGYGRYNMLVCVLCTSIVIGTTFELFSMSYLVPASACELNTTSSQQGLLACVPFIGVITTAYIWGYIADTRGRRNILIISTTTGYVAGTISSFSPNWIVFCMFKFIASASMSGATAIAMTVLSECLPAAKRGFLVMLLASVVLASTGILSVIALPILPLSFSYHIPLLDIYFNSWRALSLIYPLPTFIGAIGCFYIYESPKYLVSAGRCDEAIEVLKGMYVLNTGDTADNYKVDDLDLGEETSSAQHKGFWGSLVPQTVSMVKQPLLKHTVLLAVLNFSCYICLNAFFMWLPFIFDACMVSVQEGEGHLTICGMIRHSANSTLVQETHNCSLNTVALMLIFGINMLLSIWTVLMSRMINYFGRKRLFIGIQMVAAVAALAINSSPHWILSATLMTVCLSATFNYGILNTYCIDLFPTFVRAMALCLFRMVGRGSAIIGVNILKRLLDTNCEAAFYMFGCILLGGGFIGYLLPSDEQINEQEKVAIKNENT